MHIYSKQHKEYELQQKIWSAHIHYLWGHLDLCSWCQRTSFVEEYLDKDFKVLENWPAYELVQR